MRLFALSNLFAGENFRFVKAKIDFGMQTFLFDAFVVRETLINGGLQKGSQTAQQIPAFEEFFFKLIFPGFPQIETGVISQHPFQQLFASNVVRFHDGGDEIVVGIIANFHFVSDIFKQLGKGLRLKHIPIGHVCLQISRHAIGFFEGL